MMKKNKISSTFLLLLVISILTTGCKKYFDLNENPNLAQNPPINAMLSTATQKVALNNYRFANFNNYYAQYLASASADGASDTYQITNNTTAWDNAYYAMADLYDMMEKAKNLDAKEHLGVAQLLMVINLNYVTDTWGSVPYSKAFGLDGNLSPQYDSEESLYQASINLINQSIANLSITTTPIKLDANSDLLHGGQRALWLKTAYGIKARLLNKISKKSTYNPNDVITAINNAYSSNNDEAKMSIYTGINPWAQLAVNNAGNLLDGWLSENFINHMNGTTYGLFDPRLPKITDAITVAGYAPYIGTRNGQGNRPGTGANTIHNENYISLSSPLTDKTSPLFILTYAEVKFIEAEAQFRIGTTASKITAYNAYLSGIRANMEKLNVAEADILNYLNAPQVNVGANNLTLKLIFKEKYAALYLSPESWNDLRRFDYNYKDFLMPLGAQLPTFIRRVAYPASERSKNGTNVPAEVSLDTNLWWDKP
jgi:hypothetical protein